MNLHAESMDSHRTIPLCADDRGLLLSDLLRRKNLPLNTRCGQRGRCDGCLVEIRDSSGARTVRACEFTVDPDVSLHIFIPERSRLAHEPQTVSDFRINVPRAHAPLTSARLGLAIDIGTTTVAVLVTDMASGAILDRVSGFNRQMDLGDDILTRINLCSTDSSSVARLQHAIVSDTISPLISKALDNTKAILSDIGCIAVAGNTTMLHLLTCTDPSPMGVVPFRPVFLEHRVVSGSEIGLQVDAPVHLLPGASAYVGADLCAGVFATGLAYEKRPSLLVDVGTNGECILKVGDRIRGCATAAGPAFEGAGLTCGVRATRGAIENISFVDGRTRTKVIGNSKAFGICGSAYIDFLAEARRIGMIGTSGRFERSHLSNGAWHVNPDISISESDVASLLQAKAAIAAGILTLLSNAGLRPSEIDKVCLAGGFGMHLRVENAIACGLLPGFKAEQIQVVGNTSLAGAYLALLDSGALEEMKRIAPSIDVIELNLDPEFEDRFIDQLSLP